MEAQAGGRHLEILLLHELSSGTFARLYLAEARAPGGIERIVAVKILREQWNESTEVINRTRDEARLLARLRHKNILRVEDLSEIDGQLAIIMEFVDGLDLKQLVEALAKRGQKVPARAALQITAEAASALEAAYFKVPYGLDAPLHVVHRDIKPSNVMVSVEGELKVLDFGTARSSQEFRSVQTGALRFGSLKYMSPERREGDRGEHSADVYALGLMLLEILKGEWLPLLPMDLTEHDETIADEVSRLSALGMPNREWDIALRQVLLQMLSGDASLRPSAEQVAKLLRAFVEQAAGETLEVFAEAVVAPLARQIRGNLNGGALAGTRFIVNWSPADGAAAKPAATPAAPPPDPTRSMYAGSSPSANLAPEPAPRPPARGFDDDDESPTYAGFVPSVAPVAPSPQRAPAPPPAPPPRPAADPRATGPVAPLEVSRASSGAPPGEAAPGNNRTALYVGGAVAVLILGCAGLLGVGGGWMAFTRYQQQHALAVTQSAVEPLAPDGAAPSQGGAPPPSGGGGSLATVAGAAAASLSVSMEGSPVQWIRVHDGAGKQVLTGGAPLEGEVPSGSYQISLKQVGRPAIKAPLTVPEGGLKLVCRPGDNATVSCAGVEPALLLKP